MRRNWWIYATFFLAIVAAYAQVHDFQFVNYDDNDYVNENLHVRDGLTGSSAAWAFQSTEYANWFPLTWVDFGLRGQSAMFRRERSVDRPLYSRCPDLLVPSPLAFPIT